MSVINNLCIVCEARIGRPIDISDEEFVVSVPFCKICEKAMEETVLSKLSAAVLMVRMKERGLIDDYEIIDDDGF
jgi:hypothetical protein